VASLSSYRSNEGAAKNNQPRTHFPDFDRGSGGAIDDLIEVKKGNDGVSL
jgi:hypothetical protein